MKISIVYMSNSGNTYSLAESMRTALSGHDIVYFGEPPKRIVEAELYVVGSYTDNGSCCAEISNYLQKLEGKKIAFFFTAGYGESNEYFEGVYEHIKKNILPTTTRLSHYFCPGKMPARVRERYVEQLAQNPNDEKTKMLLANFDKVATRPNKDDLAGCKLWIRKIADTMNNFSFVPENKPGKQ